MMHRLLEGEERADSITASAPLPKLNTQASNFSLRRRSAASEEMTTVSMLNCRKHSASSAREGSFNPTSAVRAAALRTLGTGAKVVAKALCIVEGRLHFQNPLWRRWPSLQRHKGPRLEVPKCRYFFPGRGRRDITLQNICGMKNLGRCQGNQNSPQGVFIGSSAGTATRHWSRRSRKSSTWRIRSLPCGPGWGPNPCLRYRDRDSP